MKNAALKSHKAEEIPAAANGNSWEAKNNTAHLRIVLREWQEGTDGAAPAASDARAQD